MVIIFVPYPDIDASLEILDMRRLGKQRVEASQIISALEGGKGWRNHPATKMWEGHIGALKLYYNRSLEIWKRRGGKNIVLQPKEITHEEMASGFPTWWNCVHLHRSHLAALVRKDNVHYGKFAEEVGEYYLSRGYVWPAGKKISEEPNDDIFEPINERQLRPKCLKTDCSNPQKLGGYCGVHRRMTTVVKK
jgi:hypothetical protein